MGGTEFGQQVGWIECAMEHCGTLSPQFDIFLFYFLLKKERTNEMFKSKVVLSLALEI